MNHIEQAQRDAAERAITNDLIKKGLIAADIEQSGHSSLTAMRDMAFQQVNELTAEVERLKIAIAVMDAEYTEVACWFLREQLHGEQGLEWMPVSEPPDEDVTVLIFDAAAEGESVWPGYLDGRRWRYADGLIANPTHWRDMPEGPTP